MGCLGFFPYHKIARCIYTKITVFNLNLYSLPVLYPSYSLTTFFLSPVITTFLVLFLVKSLTFHDQQSLFIPPWNPLQSLQVTLTHQCLFFPLSMPSQNENWGIFSTYYGRTLLLGKAIKHSCHKRLRSRFPKQNISAPETCLDENTQIVHFYNSWKSLWNHENLLQLRPYHTNKAAES